MSEHIQRAAKIVIVTANYRWNLLFMNVNRRIVSRVVKFMLLAPLAYLLCLALVNSWHSSFKDSGLIFIRPQIPAESNAFYTLLKATNELYWPKKLESKLDDLSDNTNWDDSLAIKVLETNQTCLSSFDEAMRQPFLLVPEIESFDQDLSYLSGWKQLTFLKSIQSISLHRAKADNAALNDVFEILHFGQRVENSGGPIISYLVGENIKAIGLTRIRQMVADTTLRETNLMQAAHELDAFGPNLEGLTNALKVEYTIRCHYLDDMAKGNPTGTTNSGFERAAISFGMKPFFSPRRTKIEYAQADRSIMGNFSKSYTKSIQSPMPDTEANVPTFNILISGNAIGKIMLEMLEQPEEQTFARNISRERVNVTSTQLLLALKVYRMQHGRLPDSLSELVPVFFVQVPVDDFDG